MHDAAQLVSFLCSHAEGKAPFTNLPVDFQGALSNTLLCWILRVCRGPCTFCERHCDFASGQYCSAVSGVRGPETATCKCMQFGQILDLSRPQKTFGRAQICKHFQGQKDQRDARNPLLFTLTVPSLTAPHYGPSFPVQAYLIHADECTYSNSNQRAAAVPRILSACSAQYLLIYARESPLQSVLHGLALFLGSCCLPTTAGKAPLLRQ